MFKEELIKFLLSTENFKELDEWYISDFDDKHVHGISYEQGLSYAEETVQLNLVN